MKDVFQHNLENFINENDDIEFDCYEATQNVANGLGCTVDGHYWHLQSAVEMEYPVQVWCEQFDEVGYYAAFVIFGMGHIKYILELTNRYPENLIVVYEPNESVLLQQMQTEEMSTLINKKNVCWAVGKNRKKILIHILDECLDYRNGMDVRGAAIPNYAKMYAEEYQFCLEEIRIARDYMIVSRNTRIIDEEVRGRCYLYNMIDLSQEASIHELIEAFREANSSDIPAVLVAAGPSLDKNIEDLLPYQDKVFIVCLDSAIRTVLRVGVVPDLLVCVDPLKNPELFNNAYGKNIPLVTHTYCNYKVTQMSTGRKFYTGDLESFDVMLLKKYNTKLGALTAGGTVAHVAFSIIRELGFRDVILIGQDLAYPDKKTHTADADAEKDIDENEEKYFYVEGIDGKPVLTEYNMDLYRRWYEEQIVKNTEINIIDATEGGALIHGTRVMTLKEALEEKCNQDKPDYREIISRADYLLPKEKQNEMKREILDIVTSIPNTIKKLEKEKSVYDELDALNRNGKYNTSAYKRCIKNISEFNKEMDDDLSISLMYFFANKGNYQVSEQLQKKCKSQYDEIHLMVEVGRQLIDTYIEAGEKLLKSWGEIYANERASECIEKK